jgi:3-phenylpropionate/trans-cinnamate dioxygenase ferredoxin reductase subunit
MPDQMAQKIFGIVGASLAGGHAAHQLRKEGFDGRILLIGAESHLPYDRPPLSKGVLLGEMEPAATAIWSEEAFSEAEIDLRLGTRVTRIDTVGRTLEFGDGSAQAVDRVLLCTGSSARQPAIPGLSLRGVHAIRNLEDAISVRDELLPGSKVVIIGFGFIGAEVAACATARGCSVTLVEAAALPMQRILGPEAAELYCGLHEARGVKVLLNCGVAELRGAGRCSSVLLNDGQEIDADLVVYGVGASPSIDLAEGAGLACSNGILVNDACQTSNSEIFACGDVAARPTAFATGPIRLESWQNAYRQAIAAAKSMLGSHEPFDDLPWFWSDQYDVKMQMAGLPSSTDEVVWRGAGGGFERTAFYLAGSQVRAVLGFNRVREVRAAIELIRNGIVVDKAMLADESTNLRELAKVA